MRCFPDCNSLDVLVLLQHISSKHRNNICSKTFLDAFWICQTFHFETKIWQVCFLAFSCWFILPHKGQLHEELESHPRSHFTYAAFLWLTKFLMQTNFHRVKRRAHWDQYTSVVWFFFQLIIIIIMTRYLPLGALGRSFWLIPLEDVVLLG